MCLYKRMNGIALTKYIVRIRKSKGASACNLLPNESAKKKKKSFNVTIFVAYIER